MTNQIKITTNISIQSMKILKLEENKITFSNGYILQFTHDQDCCENVYADCKQIQALSHMNTPIYESEFDEALQFELAEGVGVHLINKSGMKYLISCYNQQNGYYSDRLEMFFYNEVNPECYIFHYKDITKKDEIG